VLCGGLSIWSHLGRQLLTLTKRGASWRDTAAGTSARLLHHFVLNLLSHRLERQIDILRRLCTGFEEWHAELAGELLSLFEGDLASIRHVTLVAHENLANTRLRVLFNFVDPRPHIVKCFSVCHVVDDDDALSASVVARSEGAEALLPSCVPNLQLNHVVFVLHGLELEIDADRIEKVLIEGVLGVAEQQARLAHSTVPDDQHLEQVVIVLVHLRHGWLPCLSVCRLIG